MLGLVFINTLYISLPYRRIMKQLYTIALAGMAYLLTATGCKQTQNCTLNVHLTGAPGDFQAVNVEIKEVWVKLYEENTGWFLLKTNKHVYNLTRLQQGKDTILATGVVPQSEIKEIRLVLGEENSVRTKGSIYPLAIARGAETGLRIQTRVPLVGTQDRLTIDFDAAASISEDGEDAYKLVPVLKLAN